MLNVYWASFFLVIVLATHFFITLYTQIHVFSLKDLRMLYYSFGLLSHLSTFITKIMYTASLFYASDLFSVW